MFSPLKRGVGVMYHSSSPETGSNLGEGRIQKKAYVDFRLEYAAPNTGQNTQHFSNHNRMKDQVGRRQLKQAPKRSQCHF